MCSQSKPQTTTTGTNKNNDKLSKRFNHRHASLSVSNCLYSSLVVRRRHDWTDRREEQDFDEKLRLAEHPKTP